MKKVNLKNNIRNCLKRPESNPPSISKYSEMNLKGTGFSNSNPFPIFCFRSYFSKLNYQGSLTGKNQNLCGSNTHLCEVVYSYYVYPSLEGNSRLVNMLPNLRKSFFEQF